MFKAQKPQHIPFSLYNIPPNTPTRSSLYVDSHSYVADLGVPGRGDAPRPHDQVYEDDEVPVRVPTPRPRPQRGCQGRAGRDVSDKGFLVSLNCEEFNLFMIIMAW